jgi:WD40 repeat protein
MAPEQAQGKLKEIGPATDVYGLGSLLYELIGGQPPFQGGTQLETLRLVVSEEPVPPRRLRPDVPRDLESIVLKCLEKAPVHRYPTARALAQDLERFLTGRPTLARPPGRFERARRWARRHPTPLLGVLVLALFGAVVLGGRAWYGAQLEASSRLAEQWDDVARQRERTVRQVQYVADIRQADRLIRSFQLRIADDLLERHRPGAGEDDRRDFAWHHLRRRIHTERRTLRGHEGDVYFAEFSPRGDLLATAGKNGTVRIWSTRSWQLARTIPSQGTEVNVATFSPDGQFLATVGDDGKFNIWSLTTGRCVLERAAHSGPAVIARFAPDGKTVITGGRKDGFIKLWDRVTGAELARFQAQDPRYNLEGAVFSPDGSILATFGGREARLWDWPSPTLFRTLGGHESIQGVAFSHSGARLATVDEGGKMVRVFELPSGRLLRELPGHTAGVFSVAFSSDDKMIISGSDDATIRFWDVASGTQRGIHPGHESRVWTVTLSPDGRTRASASMDGTVKLWDPEPGRDHTLLPIPRPDGVGFSPDGRTVLVVEFKPWAISRWDARTGRFLERVSLDLE